MTDMDTSDAAIAALNLSCRIVERLQAKGLLSTEEARQVVQGSIDLADDQHKAALQAAFKSIFGNLGL